MERDTHCLLDVNLGSVQRLVWLGIPPIVLFINPVSKTQLSEVLMYYWNRPEQSLILPKPTSSTAVSHSHRIDLKRVVEPLWEEVLRLRQVRSHLITDIIPLSVWQTAAYSELAETDCIRNVLAVIKHQQAAPVSASMKKHLCVLCCIIQKMYAIFKQMD